MFGFLLINGELPMKVKRFHTISAGQTAGT